MILDKEFQALIPPLSQEERTQLEANLVADGCRDPLVVWPLPVFTVDYSDAQDGSDMESYVYAEAQSHSHYTQDEGVSEYKTWGADEEVGEKDWPCLLLDGHNRFEICTRLGLPYEVVLKEFASREDAIEWIIHNQFGRRNLSDYQRGVLALRMKPIIEARAKTQQLRKPESVREKSHEQTPSIRTDEAVANLANISSNTIRKVEQIENTAAPEVKALAASGDVSINLAAQFALLPEEVQQEALATIAAQSEPPKEVMREALKSHRVMGTGETEWYTPAEYADMAREVMGCIDLDPASCDEANQIIQASTYYTKDDDGLTKQWKGNLWLNPPYSRQLMPAFVEKLKQSFLSGDVSSAIFLSHNNTDTAWFHSLASIASAICFPKKRIRFYRGDDIAAPPNGQAFFYLGDNAVAFAEVFGEAGFVVWLSQCCPRCQDESAFNHQTSQCLFALASGGV